ncbi:DUF6221 family protein [Oerskovia jenensis]|uniref:DUF6221 family protein n=1 Tax=Oerskovia jenensis TaxID=162169 RepID=UPI0036D95B09
MKLTDFLLARIAEDDAAVASALAVSDGPATSGHEWTTLYDSRHGVFDPEVVMSTARARGECEAKRRIIDEHHPVDPCDAHDGITLEAVTCNTLRFLALPYADHPDYDEAWRP